MLTVTCQDDVGRKLAEVHLVKPQALWPTIQSVYSEYYSTDPGSLSMDHHGQVLSMGMMSLGYVKISTSVAFRASTMDVVAENNYGEDHPAGHINHRGNVVLN